MSKLGKIIGVVAIAGAAVGGLCYFISNVKKKQSFEDEFEEDDFDDEERSYVSLDPAEGENESIKKVVTEAVNDLNAKAEEAADKVGVVKEEADTKDFEFESFDKKDEE